MSKRMTNIATMLLLLVGVVAGCTADDGPNLQDGDIIFHSSQSSQSEALRRAMKSPYTHMGVVFVGLDGPVVFEAVGPVKSTPIHEWVRRGEGGRYTVKRLKDAETRLGDDSISALRAAGAAFEGRPYDLYFEWSDERIYCSELVWKMYKHALDIEIGELQTFGHFDLSDPVVLEKLNERFPDGPPTTETVISPAAMFDSSELVTVFQQ